MRHRMYIPGLILTLLAAGVGLVSLVGWVAGFPLLAAFGPGRVPMAPSTAVLFLVYGVAVFLHARLPRNHAARRLAIALGVSGMAMAALLLALSWLGLEQA